MSLGTDTLTVFDLGILLQALAQSLKVGTLRVRSGRGEKYIYLSRGHLDSIFTRKSKIRIGRILYNQRAIEKIDLKTVFDDQKAGKVDRPIGEEMLARGMITQEQLDAAIRYQMTEELLEVFYWKDYSYEFIAGTAERSIPQVIEKFTRVGGSQDIGDLLLNVSRIIDDMDKFNQATPSTRDVWELAVDPEEFLDRQGRTPQLIELLHIIDGVRDIRELLRDMRMNRFEVMELLYRLRVEGFIRAKNGFELLMLGENQRKNVTPQKLARIYERVRELGVEGFDLSLRMAEVYEELDRPKKAAAHYLEYSENALAKDELEHAEEGARRAVRIFPESSETREALLTVLERRGKNDELLGELRKLASVYHAQCRNSKEEDTLRRALALSPGEAELLALRAQALKAMDRHEEAASVLMSYAEVRIQAGELDQAEQAAREAVEAAPDKIRYRSALLGILADRGHRGPATEQIEELASRLMERCESRGRSATRALTALRRRVELLGLAVTDAALVLAQAFARISEKDVAQDILVHAAAEHVAAGRRDDARRALEQALEILPNDPELSMGLGRILADLGELDHAMAQLRDVAQMQRAAGNLESAEAIYLDILDIQPVAPETLVELAELYSEQDRGDKAADLLGQVGRMYRAAGRPEQAVELLDRACRLAPGKTHLVRDLAETLGDVLEVDKALESFDRLLHLQNEEGRYAAAIETGLRILRTGGESDSLEPVLRDAYRSLGEALEEALEDALDE